MIATGTMTVELATARATGLLGEPPPKKLTRRVLTLAGHRPRGAALGLATAAAHVGYGAAAGAVFAVLPRPLRSVAGGAVFGVLVWAVSYMGWIPKLGLMRRPSRDRAGRPTAMVLAHVVYGATLGAAFERLHGNDTAPEARNVSVPSADEVVTVAPTSTVPAVKARDDQDTSFAVSEASQP